MSNPDPLFDPSNVLPEDDDTYEEDDTSDAAREAEDERNDRIEVYYDNYYSRGYDH